MNAISYVLHGGVAWRRLPDTCPPWRTVYRWFARLRTAQGSTCAAYGMAVEGVERFFTWINRNRRLANDLEATITSAESFLYAASAILLLRRIER